MFNGMLNRRDPFLGRPPSEIHSAYERSVLISDPAAYWRLGEERGPVARDTTGRGTDGRYIGPIVFGQVGAIASDPNKAIGLGGSRTRAYVEAPDRKAFSIASSGKGLSIEVWMRPDTLEFSGENSQPGDTYIHWLGKGEKGRYEWGFRFYSHKSDRPNRISAYVWNPDGKLGAGAYVQDRLEARAWIYLVATYDDPHTPDARVRLYKNGVTSPHNESSGTLYKTFKIRPEQNSSPVRFGTRDLQSFLAGGLDEVAIYPRVLSANEIARHWDAARAAISSSPIHYRKQ
jgi:hypothetical protein